jgi:hypothetical protein
MKKDEKNRQQLIFSRYTGIGFGTFFVINEEVAKASKGQFPPPFFISYGNELSGKTTKYLFDMQRTIKLSD